MEGLAYRQLESCGDSKMRGEGWKKNLLSYCTDQDIKNICENIEVTHSTLLNTNFGDHLV